MRLAFSNPHSPAYSAPGVMPLPGITGVGDIGDTFQTAEGIAATGAATTASILTSLSIIGGPWGAAIAGLASIGLAVAQLFRGCGQNCIAAANLDNQAATLMQQNMTAYFSSPVRTVSMQAAALNNFDTLWAAYVRAESGIPTQGAISIAERQRGGASKWCCQSPTAVHVSTQCQGGPPCCTGCDDFATMRDPIANDPNVVPDPVPGQSVVGGVVGSSGFVSGAAAGVSNMKPLLVLGAIALGVYFMVEA